MWFWPIAWLDWPAETLIAGGTLLFTGTIELVMLPLPSWPVALLPQHQTVASGISVHEPPPPDVATGMVAALAGAVTVRAAPATVSAAPVAAAARPEPVIASASAAAPPRARRRSRYLVLLGFFLLMTMSALPVSLDMLRT